MNFAMASCLLKSLLRLVKVHCSEVMLTLFTFCTGEINRQRKLTLLQVGFISLWFGKWLDKNIIISVKIHFPRELTTRSHTSYRCPTWVQELRRQIPLPEEYWVIVKRTRIRSPAPKTWNYWALSKGLIYKSKWCTHPPDFYQLYAFQILTEKQFQGRAEWSWSYCGMTFS